MSPEKMRALSVLLFLTQSGGRSAKSKFKQINFLIKIAGFQPGN